MSSIEVEVVEEDIVFGDEETPKRQPSTLADFAALSVSPFVFDDRETRYLHSDTPLVTMAKRKSVNDDLHRGKRSRSRKESGETGIHVHNTDDPIFEKGDMSKNIHHVKDRSITFAFRIITQELHTTNQRSHRGIMN